MMLATLMSITRASLSNSSIIFFLICQRRGDDGRRLPIRRRPRHVEGECKNAIKSCLLVIDLPLRRARKNVNGRNCPRLTLWRWGSPGKLYCCTSTSPLQDKRQACTVGRVGTRTAGGESIRFSTIFCAWLHGCATSDTPSKLPEHEKNNLKVIFLRSFAIFFLVEPRFGGACVHSKITESTPNGKHRGRLDSTPCLDEGVVIPQRNASECATCATASAWLLRPPSISLHALLKKNTCIVLCICIHR